MRRLLCWIRQAVCSVRGHCGCPVARVSYIGPMTVGSEYPGMMSATMPTRVRIWRECCRCGKEFG